MANERGKIGLINCGTPSVSIAGLESLAVSPGVAHILRRAGDVDPAWISTQEIRSVVSFTTGQLSLVGSAGIAGCALTTFDAYFQKNAWGATMEAYAASKHLKASMAAGQLIPRSMRCDQGGIATFSLDAFALSADGETEPITVTANQAMPASGDPTELFTLGPVKLNGTEIHCESVEVDFGITERVIAVRGQVWPIKAYIIARNPTIRLRSPEVDALSTFGIGGTAQGATDSVIVFQKCTEAGTRVAKDTAEHVSFTIDDGQISIDSHGGDAGEELSSEIVITPVYDGVAAILVVATNATFT